MSQYDAGGFNPYQEQLAEPPRTSLLAVSGFVSSVIFCCPLTSLIGLLLGVGGLVSVSASNGRRKGTGLAAAAVVISLLSLVGQAVVVQRMMPYAREYWRVMMLMTVGPQPLISDLEIGDYASARSHLYPPFEAQITDGQLKYFADEVADRYGSVQQWLQSSSSPPPGGSSAGEQTFDVTSQLVFSKKTVSVTVAVKVLIGTSGQIDQSGLAKIVIHDSDLGDLTLDENTPAVPVPESPPQSGGEEPQTEPDTGDGGGDGG